MKRTLLVIGIGIALIAAAIIYLYATIPTVVTPVKAPFGWVAASLLAEAPASAPDIAYVRRVSAVYEKVLADPIAGPPLRQWSDRSGLTRLPLLMGSADAVIWHAADGGFGFAARPDWLRRILLRIYLSASGRDDLSMDSGTLMMNASEKLGSAKSTVVSEIESLAAGLPPADLVILQREGSRGAFPPIGRPAVTAVRFARRTIFLDSLSRPEEGGFPVTAELPFALPAEAMLSIAMAKPPRLAGELNRLFATRVTPLLDAGGMFVVYDVEGRSLLPRPMGVVVLRADVAHRQALKDFVNSVASIAGQAAAVTKRSVGGVEVETREAYGMRIETAEARSELLLSFDRSSIDRYLGAPGRGAVDTSPAVWTATVIPSLALPVVGRLSRSPGFRILAPKLYRASSDLERWMTALEGASSVQVRKDLSGGQEQLRVTIHAK